MFHILPPVKALKTYLPTLKSESDLIIVLSHLGIFDSSELARSVDGIDVIISAHGGHGIEKPLRINGAIIVQNRSKGKYLGRLDLELDESGDITSYDNQFIPLSSRYAEDPEIAEIVRESQRKIVTE